jgi:hypothetical protein
MDNLQLKILNEINENGFSKCHIKDLLNQEQLQYFYNTKNLYNEVLKYPSVKKKIKTLNLTGRYPGSKKPKLGAKDYFNRGLDITDGGLVKLFLQNPFIEIAEKYYNELPKIRNITMWTHPYTPDRDNRVGAQKWHRDQEDYKILKVFINFSNISLENGATEFCVKTQHNGSLGHIHPQIFLDKKPYKTFTPSKNQEIVNAAGDIGTVSFINTNGLHRGGKVNKGLRLLAQACFLKPNAPLIQNKTLETYTSTGVNVLDYNSSEFSSLNTKQQYLLT